MATIFIAKLIDHEETWKLKMELDGVWWSWMNE